MQDNADLTQFEKGLNEIGKNLPQGDIITTTETRKPDTQAEEAVETPAGNNDAKVGDTITLPDGRKAVFDGKRYVVKIPELMDPDDFDCLRLVNNKEYNAAKACLKRGLKANNSNYAYHYYLALVEYYSGEYLKTLYHSGYVGAKAPWNYSKPVRQESYKTYAAAKKALLSSNMCRTDRTYVCSFARIGRIVFWKKNNIKIWFQKDPNIDVDFASLLPRLEVNLGSAVHLTVTDNKDEADIPVYFNDLNTTRSICSNKDALGCCQMTVSNSFAEDGVKIYMGKFDTLEENRKNERTLKSAFIHELMHALGFTEHSQNKADIMYPTTTENSPLIPGAKEAATINALFNAANYFTAMFSFRRILEFRWSRNSGRYI